MILKTLTDVGVKRSENQDNYWSAILDVNGVEAGVICICDGMGGLDKGELASKMVVSAIRDNILTYFDFNNIPEVMKKVNSDIISLCKERNIRSMGTTCTVIMCKEGVYKICHIGDSRAYIVNSRGYTQLTEDHSAIRKYGITKRNNLALYNKYKNKLTRCIGVVENIKPDIFEGTYTSGDAFFLCSDGCWHYFDEKKISLESIKDLRVLFSKCIDEGETDNLTAGVLYV